MLRPRTLLLLALSTRALAADPADAGASPQPRGACDTTIGEGLHFCRSSAPDPATACPEHRKDAVTIWRPTASGAREPVATFATEPCESTLGDPEIHRAGGVVLLVVPEQFPQNGHPDGDHALVLEAGKWVPVDAEDWRRRLESRLPPMRAADTYVRIDWDALTGHAPMRFSDDPICCPTGGEVTAWLEVRERRLAIRSVAFRPAKDAPREEVLRAPARIGALDFPAGTRVVYGEGGALRLAQPPRDVVLGGVPVKGGSTVEIGEGGSVGTATLSRPWKHQGVAVPAGERVYLQPDGGFVEGLRPTPTH
ncbi:MAG TPA: hypothetical protein VFA20_26615 [Myxococcaceae bacterium]|nr:hypothetical protein [Myxococcaceae bacterium]